MNPEQPTQEQLALWHAERQTAAIEKIRDYVFYLLMITVLGVIIGGIVALSSATGTLG